MPDALPPVFGPARAALDSAVGHGRLPRIHDPLGFACRTRVLPLRHAMTGVDVDVVIGGLPFEAEAVEQGVELALSGHRLRVAPIEDCLVMKAIAHRPRDRVDIESLLAANPHVDLTRCRRIVGEFAAAGSMPELLTDVDRLIESAHRDPGAADE